MTEKTAAKACKDQQNDAPQSDNTLSQREGRRYSVSAHRGKARGKVRYVEGNTPNGGCRFL